MLSRSVHLRAGQAFSLLLFVASVIPVDLTESTTVLHIDKFAHASAFGFLALWFAHITPPATYRLLGTKLFVFGALIELTQYFLPYRSASASDLAANAVGIVVGLSISHYIATGFRRAPRGQ